MQPYASQEQKYIAKFTIRYQLFFILHANTSAIILFSLFAFFVFFLGCRVGTNVIRAALLIAETLVVLVKFKNGCVISFIYLRLFGISTQWEFPG